MSNRIAWFDVSAGVAGDMVCGALVDAGVPLEALQRAADAVVPGAVLWQRAEVRRAGQRATHLTVVTDPSAEHERDWHTIEALVQSANLPSPVIESSLRVLGRLVAAEARVHGVAPEMVHLHEAGGLDAIADVVGACAALHELGVEHVVASPMAVGSERTRSSHGVLPVPVPAVVELTRGWAVDSGGTGELATPTGAALMTALAASCGPLPAMRLEASGIGAGSRERPDIANVVRVLVGSSTPAVAGSGSNGTQHLLSTNVDDMDARLWPGALESLLAAGAADAWLTPILMKKGRPAFTLTVLVGAAAVEQVRREIYAVTSTIGMREQTVMKHALERDEARIEVDGHSVRVKVAHAEGTIVHATPEWEDVAVLARATDRTPRAALERSIAALVGQGLVEGAAMPRPATGS